MALRLGAGHTYQKFLGGNALVCSMSAVGHCADNAACEGFFGQIKRERVNHRQCRTRDEARADRFDYLKRFHNPRMRRRVARQDRRLSALTDLSEILCARRGYHASLRVNRVPKSTANWLITGRQS